MPTRPLTVAAAFVAFGFVAQASNPIESLDVRYLPVGAMLSWTCADGEVTGFAVERSTDGFSFEVVTHVEADYALAGVYNYLDADRPDERHYYRVTSFDRAGSSSYSPVADAARPGTATWALAGEFGVDVTERFDFEVEAEAVTMLTCTLFDFLGAEVRSVELLVTPGPNRLSVATADLSPGAFRLDIRGEDMSESVRFLKVAHEVDIPEPLVRGF